MSRKQPIVRKSFARLREVAPMPPLLEVQIESFNEFLQPDAEPTEREDKGLQAVFNEIFPIEDVHGNFRLEFVSYHIGTPRYTITECRERNMTYAAPLKATLQLVVLDHESEEPDAVREVIVNDVFLGEMPLMTEYGTFVIHGAERVVVSQLHRSPGVFFDETTHPNGKRLFAGRIIPLRGSWVEFTLDVNDVMFVNIDSRRKIPVTTLLRALARDEASATNEAILLTFHATKAYALKGQKWREVLGQFSAVSLVDSERGTPVVDAGEEITEAHVERLRDLGYDEIECLDVDPRRDSGVLRNTLRKDTTTSREQALFKIYSLIRPGEPPSVEAAEQLLERLFFTPRRYDLGDVGRYKLNARLEVDVDPKQATLDRRDIRAIIGYLIALREGRGYVDDIDHLGNRRVRTVGELLGAQYSVGLSRMARTIRERMSLRDTDKIAPHDLVNARTVSSVIDAFFGSSQLSQFMDQTNPLAELTHKRRLSALGPGGLTRERAGFEVRDVHHTHYGRICPIETPEGPNIGLIAYLTCYARVNSMGFLETPYRRVVNGKASEEITYLTADVEDRYTIAQANAQLASNGAFLDETVKCRHGSDFPAARPEEIEFMDVAPRQVVSVAASLIPFLEHDDANRALMGSNMQRQAVPLLLPESPYIGTGMESRAALDSGAMMIAKRAGTVEYVSADRIVIKPRLSSTRSAAEMEEFDTHELVKFRRSNQDTCINQRPIVEVGDRVEEGQVVADGSGTDRGELALGRNCLVAFMPWQGYNFEDAVIVNERFVEDDAYTSLHIEEFELQVRDTKRGPEEITREIPNVSEEAVMNLDDRGIVRTGAEVIAGDILVGKVTPKGETELSPEERLLRAIFGEKAGDVRDASLKSPPGMKGVVIDAKVFSRKEHSEEAKRVERNEVARVKRQYTREIESLEKLRAEKLRSLLVGKQAGTIRDPEGSVVMRSGQMWREEHVEKLDFDLCIAEDGWARDKKVDRTVGALLRSARDLIVHKRERMTIEVDRVMRGAELPPGVRQLVKVAVATKRKLAVGDKMAGRHGNKGVVSRIVPEEDMPYLPDGRTVDIVLNPLGVPSRMNVGQVLETHLGWAAAVLGTYVASPVFDGAKYEEVVQMLKDAGLPADGKTPLYDGRTGEPFAERVTVGAIYMMKLSHLVDDKIHARSIGPYSLVTQQPLGGKAQFGGQRFGEMEVWALQAYGAAYTLQEMLTVKSDDVAGRSRMYEAIVKGENPPEPGVPESFNVLVKELQALALDVELVESERR